MQVLAEGSPPASMRVGVSKKVQCTCFTCFTSTKVASLLALLVQKYLAGEGLEKRSVRG